MVKSLFDYSLLYTSEMLMVPTVAISLKNSFAYIKAVCTHKMNTLEALR